MARDDFVRGEVALEDVEVSGDAGVEVLLMPDDVNLDIGRAQEHAVPGDEREALVDVFAECVDFIIREGFLVRYLDFMRRVKVLGEGVEDTCMLRKQPRTAVPLGDFTL